MPRQKQDEETPWDSPKQRMRKRFNRMTQQEQLDAISDRGWEREVYRDSVPPGWPLPEDLRKLDYSDDIELDIYRWPEKKRKQ